MSLSALYSIPRLFQLSSRLLRKRHLSVLNIGRVYSASLKLMPAGSEQPRGFKHEQSPTDQTAKLIREWVRDLSEFILPRLKMILDLAEKRKGDFVALAQSGEALFSEEDFDLLLQGFEEETSIMKIGVAQERAESSSLLPQSQLPLPNQGDVDYQKLLIHVTSRLMHAKQAGSSRFPKKWESRLNSGRQSPRYRASESSISPLSPASRVSFSLADVSSGRATPNNRTGRLVLDDDLALDHSPETLKC